MPAKHTLGPVDNVEQLHSLLKYFDKDVWRKVARMMQKYWKIRDGSWDIRTRSLDKRKASKYLTQALQDTRLPYLIETELYFFNIRNSK